MSTAHTNSKTAPRLREGIYWHAPSGQYASRVGFDLNASGKRVRAGQNLSSDPSTAETKHAELIRDWTWTKHTWNEPLIDSGMTLREFVKLGLPLGIRDTAEIDLPVHVKLEWRERAMESLRAAGKALVAGAIAAAINKIKANVEKVESGKTYLSAIDHNDPALQKLLSAMPADLRSRIFAAIQPPANEVAGFTVDAERLTVEQAKTRYLADLQSRIDLPEDGIKAGTYRNAEGMLRLALGITVMDATGTTRRAIDPKTMLHDLTRDDLVAFKRAWLAKITAGEVAKRTAANYCRAVQYFLKWIFKRERIISRRVPDLDEVFRFSDVNPINIADYSTVKAGLKTIISEAPERVRLYVLLALNLGAYQSDIGSIKLTEIEERDGGTFIVRGREKTSHQNDFKSMHYIWPEVAKLLKSHLASSDPQTNPQGLALLNEDGQPLYQSKDDGKNDNIATAYGRLIRSINATAKEKNPDAESICLAFKQYRKLGATAMNDIGGETVQRAYRTAAIGDGADRFYVRGDFSKLTAALKKWRLVLKRDGILT